jgi:hypothetical protein
LHILTQEGGGAFSQLLVVIALHGDGGTVEAVTSIDGHGQQPKPRPMNTIYVRTYVQGAHMRAAACGQALRVDVITCYSVYETVNETFETHVKDAIARPKWNL